MKTAYGPTTIVISETASSYLMRPSSKALGLFGSRIRKTLADRALSVAELVRVWQDDVRGGRSWKRSWWAEVGIGDGQLL